MEASSDTTHKEVKMNHNKNDSINIQKIPDAQQPIARPIQLWNLHRDRVSSLVIVGDKIITCSEDAQLLVTSPTEGTFLLERHRLPINHLVLDQDKERFLACSDDGSIYVYDTQHFEEILKIEGFDDTGIRKAFFSSNQKIIAACNSPDSFVHGYSPARSPLTPNRKVTHTSHTLKHSKAIF